MKRLLLPLLLCAASAHALEDRAWTDKTTGKTLQATMVAADPKARTVTIKRADGQTFQLSVDRLVEADLAYIKDNLAALSAPTPAPSTPPPAEPPKPADAPTPPDSSKPAEPAKPAPKPKAPEVDNSPPAPARPTIVTTPAKKFKHPAGNAVLGMVKKEHPRVLINAAGLAALKNRAESDASTKRLYESLKKTAEGVIEKPELVQVRGEAGAGGGGPGAKSIFRMTALGLLQGIDNDPRWKDYAVREMLSIASFTNWHPTEMKSNSEFVWGMAIGYDHFRKAMNEEQAKKIRAGLVELGVEALVANFKGEPLPVTTTRPEAGQQRTSNKPDPKTARKGFDEKNPDAEEMQSACALLLAAIAIADEEPNVAGPAANIALKVIGEGVQKFSPDGIWPEGVLAGDEVLDALASVIMTLRSLGGNDFGISLVDGIPQASLARMHLTGPSGSIFNYGDALSGNLTRNWVTSFLAGQYGNPGVPALKVPGPANIESLHMNLAGLLLYQNPYIGGSGTPDALDAAFYGKDQVITMRSAWKDPSAYYVGVKGGDNSHYTQLDLGNFVLDAGGVRWAIDLGTESDRILSNRHSTAKFDKYREATVGQNTWIFAKGNEKADDKPKGNNNNKSKGPALPATALPGCQPLDAKAPIIGFSTNADQGSGIIDLSDAYSAKVKTLHRGVKLVRGEKPYVLMQDELQVKSQCSPEWFMHTRATVTVDGSKAILKSGTQTLTMTIVSPAGASFSAAELKDEDINKGNQQLGSVKGITLIKIPLADAKGQHTVAVTFALGETAPAVTLTPLAQWIPKKR